MYTYLNTIEIMSSTAAGLGFHNHVIPLVSKFMKTKDSFVILVASCHHWYGTGFGNQFIFGYEVEVELSIQLENANEVEYE